MSIAERSERAKMLVHFQESFLRLSLQEYPALNFVEVAAKWMSGKSVQFTELLSVSPEYQFSNKNGNHLTLLSKLFEKVVQPISYEEIDELVRGYVNCDVFLEPQEVSDKHKVMRTIQWSNGMAKDEITFYTDGTMIGSLPDDFFRKYNPETGWETYTSLDYGTFPEYDDFEAMVGFVSESDCGTIEFSNDPYVGTCNLKAIQLWNWLHQISQVDSDNTREEVDSAMNWCENILRKLGWEWVK